MIPPEGEIKDLKFNGHILEGVPFHESPNQSGNFNPRGIILHDTAGRIEPVENTLRWFQRKVAKASAHFTIDREGMIGQSVRCDRKAWHAGKSSYKGQRNCNAFTFGIELVNPGIMNAINSLQSRTWYGEVFNNHDCDIYKHTTPEHGSGMWMTYTAPQIEACIELCAALEDEYRVDFITTHWAVSPGRKVDTNPLFPLTKVRSMVFGRHGNDEIIEDFDGFALVNSNMRRWPSRGSTKVHTMPRGTGVEVIRSGYFSHDYDEEEQWLLCRGDGHEGWVWGQLIDLD